jgi:hypothetical protein
MSASGMLDYALWDFAEVCFLRNLMPFDGQNPNHIVILNNASMHHAGDNVWLIEPWSLCSLPKFPT